MSSRDPVTAFVSNLDRPVYAIYGLPEEVVAVIFAYVSRSPHSFRDHLRTLLTEDWADVRPSEGVLTLRGASETARRFHEKWVVGYGHASVAEHAVVHLGVEAVSRIASAELELASHFLSFTEFSQRYQRPARGRFVTPPELPPQRLSCYRALQDAAFSAYEELLAGLKQHHESAGVAPARAEKLAFEDARYALTLATETSLGCTGNARALREAIVRLKASAYAEVRNLAEALAEEASTVVPTLLRHLAAEAMPASAPRTDGALSLEDYTGRGSERPLAAALTAMGIHPPTLQRLRELLPPLSEHALEPPILDQVRYRFTASCSEASWHQLLRHNRRVDFLYGPPTPAGGLVIPPHVVEAGLSEVLLRLDEASQETHRLLVAESPAAAAYVVLNAHRRTIQISCSLRGLVHLLRLRGAANAQWEIRELVQAMGKAVEGVHPGLLPSLLGREER